MLVRLAIRVLGMAAVIAALGTLLTGCSPGNWPTLAVLLVDGRPAALAAPCPADKLTLLDVAELRGEHSDEWPRWQSQGSRPLGDGETVALLDDPDGWRTTRSELPEIDDGSTYSVEAVGEQVSFSVEFTLADLRGLTADQVWTTTDGRTNRAVPRPEFQRTANADCGR